MSEQKTFAIETVHVDLDNRAYDIKIGSGLIAQAGQRIRDLYGTPRVFAVTDENVGHVHLQALLNGLEDAGLLSAHIVLPAGEATKSFQMLERVCSAILDARVERGDLVIALGGGVVGDLTGFAAAIVRRGVRYVQIPTSILAQVDSSVGGKTAINASQGKNLIGAFHQPCLVLCDTAALDTLSPRHMIAGYAEVVKYALINDLEFFYWLERNADKLMVDGPERLEAIEQSCRHKATIVAADEFEAGQRALLNLGHTFGHALEALTKYSDRLVHGEAIAIGMIQAFRFSIAQGHGRDNLSQDLGRVIRHFEKMGLPTHISQIRAPHGPDEGGDLKDPKAILDAIYQDKKVESGALTFILTQGIGQAFVAKNVDAGAVLEFLQEDFARSPYDL